MVTLDFIIIILYFFLILFEYQMEETRGKRGEILNAHYFPASEHHIIL